MNQSAKDDVVKSAGIISLSQPVMMPDGKAYRYIWHDWWGFTSDGGIIAIVTTTVGGQDPIAKFHADVCVGFVDVSELDYKRMNPALSVFDFYKGEIDAS